MVDNPYRENEKKTLRCTVILQWKNYIKTTNKNKTKVKCVCSKTISENITQ